MESKSELEFKLRWNWSQDFESVSKSVRWELESVGTRLVESETESESIGVLWSQSLN